MVATLVERKMLNHTHWTFMIMLAHETHVYNYSSIFKITQFVYSCKYAMINVNMSKAQAKYKVSSPRGIV